jgi:hypothetical protein
MINIFREMELYPAVEAPELDGITTIQGIAVSLLKCSELAVSAQERLQTTGSEVSTTRPEMWYVNRVTLLCCQGGG